MRTVELINIDNKEIEFTELYYLDGSKLEVSNDTQTILVWYDEHDSYEDWLLIKSSKPRYMEYISNKIPLLDVIKENTIYFTKRHYKTYDEIEIVKEIVNIEEYVYMPTEKSFLNFNYASELCEENLFCFKSLSALEFISIVNKNSTEKAPRVKVNVDTTLFEHLDALKLPYSFNVKAANDTSYKRSEYARK